MQQVREKASCEHKFGPRNALGHREVSKAKVVLDEFVNTGISDLATLDCHVVTKLVGKRQAVITQFFTVN